MTPATFRALAALAILASMTPPPAAQATHGAYVPHGPIACVHDTFPSTYAGLNWDPSGVTGSGTVEDPFVVAGFSIDATAHATHPAAILIHECSHVRIQETQVFGNLGRDPQCSGPDGVHPGETVTYAVHVVNSYDVVLDNTVIKYGRLAGILYDASSGEILRSDVKVNFGTGILARNGASVHVEESYIAFNGYFVPEDHETRDGWVVPTFASGVYATGGAVLDLFNNSLFANNNAIVVDKTLTTDTTGTFNENAVEQSNWHEIRVLGFGEAPRVALCTDPIAPAWWRNMGPEPGGAEDFGQAETSRSAAPAPTAPSLLGDPLGGEDYTKDPANVVNARLNFWGRFEGPSTEQVSGRVDTRLWLPTAPPASAVAGASRAYGVDHDARSLQGMAARLLP